MLMLAIITVCKGYVGTGTISCDTVTTDESDSHVEIRPAATRLGGSGQLLQSSDSRPGRRPSKGRVRLLMASVGYWRYWPNAVVAKLTPAKNAAILDVSSPKVLSLYLASRGHTLTATDLDDAKIFSRWQKLARYSGPGSYKAEYQDARHLAYPDNSFDIVYSISVIEHIPDRGDAEALEEFGRVVRPGGHVIVEVPYRHQGRDYFFDYDSKGARLENPQFYERHYDAKTLRERLMNPAGLKLTGVLYQGEQRAIDPWIATRRLPRLPGLLFCRSSRCSPRGTCGSSPSRPANGRWPRSLYFRRVK